MRLVLFIVAASAGVMASLKFLAPQEDLSTRRLMEKVLAQHAKKDRKVRPMQLIRTRITESERKSA